MVTKKDAQWWRDYRARRASAAEVAQPVENWEVRARNAEALVEKLRPGGLVHAACDQKIADLEAEVARWRALAETPIF